MTFKQILKDITENKDMTQAEMAEWLGYSSQQAFSAKISRANNMNASELLRILNKFGYRVKIEKWGGEKYEATQEETEKAEITVPQKVMSEEEVVADMMRMLEEASK